MVMVIFRLVDSAWRLALLSVAAAMYGMWAVAAVGVDMMAHMAAWKGDEPLCTRFGRGNISNAVATAMYSSIAFAGCDLTRPTWAAPFRQGPWNASLIALLAIRVTEAIAFMSLLLWVPSSGAGRMFKDEFGSAALTGLLALTCAAVGLNLVYTYFVSRIREKVRKQ